LPVGAIAPVPAGGLAMSSATLELVLERVAAAGVDLRENGADRWRGDCVGCGGDDRMTVRLDLNGNVWIDCYGATCGEQDRLKALNLTGAQLRARSRLDDVDDGDIGPTLGHVPDYPVYTLPAPARALAESAVADGLPATLVAGATLGAMAIAIGGGPSIEITPTWRERAILWIVNIAPRGAGKSPSQDRALHPLRIHDAQLDDEQPTLRVGDTTLEAIARDLAARTGQAGVDIDELVVLLRGLGEYKRGRGADRGRFLQLWEGAPWTFSRVGGGTKTNKVNLRIPAPTLAIVGGLQPALHDLLGGDEDGLRPRWLPHLATLPDVACVERRPSDAGWSQLLDRLLDNRDRERIRVLDDAALRAFNAHRARWARHQRDRSTSATLAAALAKADRHLARVALVLAEADRPGVDATVDAATIGRAAEIIDFTLACWAALPEQGTLSLTYRDRLLDQAISRLIAWLEEHGGEATRRQLQRARVAGVRTAADLNALLERYEAMYPGCVNVVETEGRPGVVVKAPVRGGAYLVTTGDEVRPPAPNPSPGAKTADNGGGDKGALSPDAPGAWNGELSYEEKRRRVMEIIAAAQAEDDPPWAGR
jgi:hypothetical protein